MRVTSPALSKGFWGRTLDVLRRQTNIVIKQENLHGPSGPYILQEFPTASDVADLKLMSDQEFGGYSTSLAEHVITSPTRAHLRWHGNISFELPKDRFAVKRSGFAAFRTHDQKLSAFGYGVWNVDPYHYLALRVKSDGRAYYVNVMTESIVPQDVFQHRLFAKRPGEWETVLIPWRDFMRTNHGMVIDPQIQLIKQKVLTVGISLIDRRPGPFELLVEKMYATHDMFDHTMSEKKALATNGLKNKKGEEVAWKMDS